MEAASAAGTPTASSAAFARLPVALLAAAAVLLATAWRYGYFGDGLWVLLFSPRSREYRFLGWTTVGVIALFILSNGRYYYAAGMFGALWAAAAVHFGRLKPSPWFRWVPTWPVFLLSALYTLPYALPVWPDLARSVADAYHRLPPEQRARTTLVTAGCTGRPEHWTGTAPITDFPPSTAPAVASGISAIRPRPRTPCCSSVPILGGCTVRSPTPAPFPASTTRSASAT
ncbi:hypothetical protein [Amycolatopsis coloradensis]|uniref:hypothetical protein n=1 Tax=Amycolatopsis coloradensis TaxID=76021 RepID=UPI001FC90CA1|nr:hypothetical protein [Amycolatopsis coloradensis]